MTPVSHLTSLLYSSFRLKHGLLIRLITVGDLINFATTTLVPTPFPPHIVLSLDSMRLDEAWYAFKTSLRADLLVEHFYPTMFHLHSRKHLDLSLPRTMIPDCCVALNADLLRSRLLLLRVDEVSGPLGLQRSCAAQGLVVSPLYRT